MNLRELLQGIEILEISGPSDLSISGLHYDSRRIQPGNLFVAIRGEKTDGNRYIPQARERGAIAVASEAGRDSSATSAAGTGRDVSSWIRVKDARQALALASGNFFLHPAHAIQLVGITGTNGKTTTAFLVESILSSVGTISALFGTIEYHLAGQRLPAPNTTPESLDLQSYLAELRSKDGTHAVMEVSSHALAMDRVYGLPFQVAVFSNLTRDHLDFHGTMEAYFAEKRKLFTGHGAEPPRWAVLNADDAWSQRLRDCGSPNVLTYGIDSSDAQMRPAQLNARPQTGEFVIESPAGRIHSRSPLIGRPNAYNVLAATGACVALGLRVEQIESGLAALETVPGRFERVHAGQPFLVVVDYAHTDDALRNVLATARSFVRDGARVISVFGCGGDRDRTKRPLMGQAAGAGSDYVIVTSDNPRSEDPMAIINDALAGLQKSRAEYRVEPDRARAIDVAIREALAGDVVVIAGKGHETYQTIGKQVLPFDDRSVAREALSRLGYV